MEWDVAFEPDAGPMVLTASGKFTVADNRLITDDILEHEAWRPGHAILFDARNVDLSDVHHAELVAARSDLVAVAKRFGSPRIAILTQSGSDYGVMRQMEMMTDESDGADLHIFIEEGEAREWLNR